MHDQPVTLSVQAAANAGFLTARSSNQSIAVVALGTGHNQFTIAPGTGGHGSATVTFTNPAGPSIAVVVTEAFDAASSQPPAGTASAAPDDKPRIAPPPAPPRLGQSFVRLQPGITSRVTVAEPNYAGRYTVTGANPAIANVTLEGSGANAALLVQARSAGICTAIVRDAAGRQTTLLIRVEASGMRRSLPAARRPS
ncbi:MAG: hypothetical protein ACREM8_04475 [Vulcanimicrobiaceae bacterium]